jgi:hypothetical protein
MTETASLPDGQAQDPTGDSQSEVNQGRQKENHRRWTLAVRQCVANYLFKCVQFANRNRDIDMGSDIQKIACKECDIPTGERQECWHNSGMDVVLEVTRRKRQAVATSMKLKFRSEQGLVDINVKCNALQISTNKCTHC